MRAALLLLAALAVCAPAVRAAQAPRALALELWINGVSTHRTLLVEPSADGFLVSRKALIAEGLLLAEGADAIRLDGGTPIRASVDAGSQRLMLSAPARYLKPQRFDLKPPLDLAVDTSAVGLTIGYDLFAQASDLGDVAGSASSGGTGTASLFMPAGVLRASGFGRVSGGMSQGARLDTTFLIDQPEQVRSWSFGDAIGGGLSWSRPVRFAGVQLASNYALRPDLVTIPLPAFFGDTAVPASVDVLVGAAKVFETDVDPGPFELHNLPIVTGGSEATVVVRDALGRETSQTIALYDTGDLLAPGLNEYSLEAGFLRRGYGIESFGYGAPVASATWRRGLSDTLTVQAHGEVAGEVQMLGGGVILALEPYATIGMDLAASTHDGRDGALASLSLHGQWDRFTFFGDYQCTTRDFADLATLDDAPLPRHALQLGLGASLDRFGSLSLSSIDRNDASGAPSHLISGSYSLSLENRFLTLTGFYDRRTGRWYSGLMLSILLGDRNVATVSAQAARDSKTATLAYEHEGDPDGGVGYRAALSAGEGAGLDLQGVWYGERLTADAELSAARGQAGARLGLDGSLVVLGGDVYAARAGDDAVALVETGAPNVRIYRENRQVAVSDANGRALVPGLVPFNANRIAVEPGDYPLTTVVEQDERLVVPRRYGATVVDLAPHRKAPVLVVVRLENGLFPAPGARATLGDAEYVVGRNGKLFLDDLAAGAEVTIDFPEGACRIFVVPPKPMGGRIPKLGPLLCQTVTAHAA